MNAWNEILNTYEVAVKLKLLEEIENEMRAPVIKLIERLWPMGTYERIEEIYNETVLIIINNKKETLKESYRRFQ